MIADPDTDAFMKMQDAARLAEQITVNSDDTYIGIRLRSYGFLVEATKEVGDKMRNLNRQVTWLDVEQARVNALLSAVQDLQNWAATQ